MSTIDSYIMHVAKKYPRTKEVVEQLEEIRDTLHIKTEEFQAQGLGYEEAAHAAIDSVGELGGLMSDVAGETRTVYVNRLWLQVSVIAMIIVSAEFLLAFVSSVGTVYSDSVVLETLRLFFHPISIVHVGGAGMFWAACFSVLVAIWVWPVVSIIKFILGPRKTGVVQIRFKQLITIAWIGWLALSAVLFMVNMLNTSPNLWYTLWFVWPVIFLSNWPLIIWNYGRRIRSGKYDA